MPLSTQSQEDDAQYILVASLDNARNISNVLKAITFKDHAIFSATPNGLKADIFQEFTIKEDSVGFQVNLTVLLDCLTIFGGSTVPGVTTALRMCYAGYGYPLTLFLEEGGVVTVCKINTEEPEEPIDFDFCSNNVTNKVILQSESLKEAFSELDMTSEVLQITMSPSQPYFRYKMSLLKPSTKALALSCKVSVRTDSRGFLSLQYLVRNDNGQICFVEYYCCPDEEVAED
ncbi:hypothetical protein CRUP_032352 [Coryphaenoides rupestris]|nr:hypothetical protein CRUP_032352 [Coryphaenoides rupestris]